MRGEVTSSRALGTRGGGGRRFSCGARRWSWCRLDGIDSICIIICVTVQVQPTYEMGRAGADAGRHADEVCLTISHLNYCLLPCWHGFLLNRGNHFVTTEIACFDKFSIPQ
ncbi:hypothetical protein L1049_002528 [Liquidambar formosana]|uniref:Uncharacterized protein n=1 Tax=Liquidambar formosana TaxID=63359 RepID=A0AAP0R6S5_LIQFO